MPDRKPVHTIDSLLDWLKKHDAEKALAKKQKSTK